MGLQVGIKSYRGLAVDLDAYVRVYTLEITPSKKEASARLAIYASRDAYLADPDNNVIAWDRITVSGDEFDYYLGSLLSSSEGANIVGVVYGIIGTKEGPQTGLDFTKAQPVIDPGQTPVDVVAPYTPPAEDAK